MAKSPAELPARSFTASDGVKLAWYETGEGRPLLLLHGFVSDAFTNWIRFGHAALLADAGYRVIMPDLRAHGASGHPHDPAFYPKNVLARDALEFVAHLGLEDYDLGGYSLGARTIAAMLARGASPARVILAGMGLEGLTEANRRAGYFRNIFTNLGNHARGSPEWLAEAFLKTTGADPRALLRVVDTFVDTTADMLATFDWPVGVICGAEDRDNGDPAALVAALPRARLIEVPGNHMSAVTRAELGEAMRDFLREA